MVRRKQTSVLEDAIYVLSQPEGQETAHRASALCDLVSWMWEPYDTELATDISHFCLLTYLAGRMKSGVDYGSEIVSLTRETGLQFLVDYGDFGISIVDGFKFPQDKFDYLGQIVRFLISYTPAGELNKRNAPSLAKSYHALKHGVYGPKWNRSLAYHADVLRSYKPSAAFIAVDRLEYRRLLPLSPPRKDFAEACAAILSDPKHLRRYLAQVKWTQLRLLEILDTNVLDGQVLPSLPADLETVQLKLTPIDENQRKIMKTYRST